MIGLLRRFVARAASSAAPVLPLGPGPEPLRLPVLADGENPIQRLLDEIGLPWRQTRAELEAEHGVEADPLHDWDVITFGGTKSIVQGLLRPLSAQAFPRFSPKVPIARFSGEAWFADEACDNLRRAAADISARLGPAPVGRSYNTLVSSWACGAASIRLLAWPQHWQSDPLLNPSIEREPRLATACHITVETGFRPRLTPREQGWLDGFVPVSAIEGNRLATLPRLRTSPPPEGEVEFVREPPARLEHIFGQVGCSAGGEALIFCLDQLYVVPVTAVLGFRVDRVLPAKGGGGSSLEVECETGYAAVPVKQITIARAGGPEDLNDVGATMAAAMKRPCVIGEYGYDV